jgi:diacylglycerol kinase family enzyme
LVIEFEDGTSYDGHVLLTAIGNGAFCGGGLKGVAYAEYNDELMDVCVIKDVPRFTIILLLSRFADGTYLARESLKKYIIYKKCKTVQIERNETNHSLCVDVEIKTMGKTLFEVVPAAIKFVIPSLD